MMKFKLLALSLLAALPSLSAAQEVRPDVHVSYGDLDLRSAVGVKALDRRLARAVKAVCPTADGTVDQARKRAVQRCLAMKTAEVAIQRDRVLAETETTGAMALSVP